jgi:hypothetical protein
MSRVSIDIEEEEKRLTTCPTIIIGCVGTASALLSDSLSEVALSFSFQEEWREEWMSGGRGTGWGKKGKIKTAAEAEKEKGRENGRRARREDGEVKGDCWKTSTM